MICPAPSADRSFNKMIASSLTISLLLLSGHASAADARSTENSDVGSAHIRQTIDDLGSRSYQTRMRCRASLAGWANQNPQLRRQVICLLHDADQNPDAEIRIASREILSDIQQRFGGQVLGAQSAGTQRSASATLLADRQNLAAIPAWRAFRARFGSDADSQELFWQMYRRHHHTLDASFTDSGRNKNAASSKFQTQPVNLMRIDRNDGATWSTVLFLDCAGIGQSTGPFAWQLLTSLSRSGSGPSESLAYDPAFRRMIAHWVETHRAIGTPADQIRIVMKYRCEDTVLALCRETLRATDCTPANSVTAMLAWSALRSSQQRAYQVPHRSLESEFQAALASRMEDRRTFWTHRCGPSQQEFLRVQVRDVALAVGLREVGIDPRSAGFRHLQADPVFVYRDQSLGFSSDSQREQVHQAARKQLPR